MISRIIEWCSRNQFIVFTGAILLVAGGIWSMRRVPLDALPDISDVQVIIHTPWSGEPPNVIEDQVTYPIVSALLSAPRVKGVRAQTMFGDSYVFVVFEDGTDLYWARSRVTEYLQQIAGRLPADVHPAIGPDATSAGWVYEYAILDRSHTHSLADLRSLQDWYLRYQLETVPGVAEVASIGGFVRQYQVNLDPRKLFSYGISAATVIDRIRQSTNEVGGGVLDMNGAEYMVRGLGYFRSLSDLENVAVATKNGTPVLVRDLGTVSFGPDIRRGAADWQGKGETVGGIVVMRYGGNALNVINGVKAKLREIAPSLPPGVEIATGYDRSWVIDESIHTLKRDLILEAIIVSFVSIAFLFHFRSALVPILTLPIAVLAAFIPMYYLHVSSNIMSLGGLALAIGVLIDAAIVMVENGYRHLAERNGTIGSDAAERRLIIVRAAQQVGPALFYSLIIIVVSFLPVFLLEAQEGRMFRPLAWTKTLALVFASLLSITLVPALMPLCLRGRLRPESRNPAARISQALYLPVLRWCLRHWKLVIALNLAFLAATVPLYFRLGSQFMPALFEGSALYMPSALPGISVPQAASLMQEQDRIIRSFPEGATVFGTVGRSDSATDNAPLDMYDTTIVLKPRSQWRAGMTYEKLIGAMDRKLQFPGLTNTWAMPVQGRLDMELTGIRTPVGIKIQGPVLGRIQ
jgi:Cu(I)/Ag(I) efflux system membrane protein CusA/SilA